MVSITLEGLLTVSDKIFDFQFFIKFHRSRPAIIFNFSNIPSMLSYASKISQSSQDLSGPHQDGEYYTGKIMDGF